MGKNTMQKAGGQPSGVSGVTSAPLRATVSILSEGRRLCYRCGMPINGLAGYLEGAEGRFIGVVHEKCVLPEELGEERPEPEGVATVPEQGPRGATLGLSKAVSEALAGAGIRVETRGEHVFFHIERRALPLAETFLPETGMKGRTEGGHESWGYRVAGRAS